MCVCECLRMHVHRLFEIDRNMLSLSQHSSLRVAAEQGSVSVDSVLRGQKTPASVNLPVEFRLLR